MSVIIRLQRLAETAKASDIRALFAGLKIPEGAVHIVGGPDGDAFIGFATDEDARQAMRHDGRRIHDQRIHLLLSSRVEMETVIAHARAGEFDATSSGGGASTASTTMKPPPPTPRVPSSASMDHRGSANRVSPSRSSPPSQRSSLPLPQYSPPDPYNRNATAHSATIGGGQMLQQRQQAPTEISRGNEPPVWPPPVHATVPTQQPSPFVVRGAAQPAASGFPPSHQEPKNPPVSASTGESWKPRPSPMPSLPDAGPAAALGGGGRGGMTPWQDLSLAQAAADVHRGAVAPPQAYDSGSGDANGVFHGYTASMQQSANAIGLPAAAPFVANVVQDPASRRMRPSLLPQPAPGDVHVLDAHQMQQGIPAQDFMPGLLSDDPRYVELSRLPSELLRPAALEQFLRPTMPLTLSAVKVVFDPQGFPVHTLVRFESTYDAAQVLSRNGEQGIRIRPSTRTDFETAIDGSLKMPAAFLPGLAPTLLPVPVASPLIDPMILSTRDRSPPPMPGLAPPSSSFRRSRGRSRTPSPPAKRARKNSGPERFCLELTNVPFRTNEHDIADFLGPRLKPLLVQRSYYEDSRPSDRWIIEIASRDDAERASRIHSRIADRAIRIRKVTGEEADRLLAIPDTFGAMRKAQWEDKHGPTPPAPVPSSMPLRRGDSDHREFASFSKPGRRDNYDDGNRRRDDRRNSADGPLGDYDDRRGGFDDGDRTGGYGSAPPQDPYPPPGRNNGGPMPLRGASRGFARGRGGRGGANKHLSDEPPPQFFASPPSFGGGGTRPPHPQAFPRGGGGFGGRPGGGPPFDGGMRMAGGHANSSRPELSAAPMSKEASGEPCFSYRSGSCLAIKNVPAMRDRDLFEFLQLDGDGLAGKIWHSNDGTTVYIDVGSETIAQRTAVAKNHTYLGANCLQIAVIGRDEMNAAVAGDQKQAPPLMPQSAKQEEADIDPEVIASIGRPGTVIAVHGLPATITLDDLVAFFDHYSLLEASVRMHFDDDGQPTGDCLLAVATPQEAAKAVKLLSGRRLNGSTVTMSVVQGK